MAQETVNGADQGIGPLVRGIVGDVQTLVAQQVDLLKTEVLVDFRKTRDAAMVLGIGLTITFVGVLLLCFSLANLLHWSTAPVGQDMDQGRLPLWACYGLIGLVVGGVGGYVLNLAREKFASFNPLPEKSAEAIKETLEWKTTTSPK